MADRPGDNSKQPPECDDQKDRCPYLKEVGGAENPTFSITRT